MHQIACVCAYAHCANDYHHLHAWISFIFGATRTCMSIIHQYNILSSPKYHQMSSKCRPNISHHSPNISHHPVVIHPISSHPCYPSISRTLSTSIRIVASPSSSANPMSSSIQSHLILLSSQYITYTFYYWPHVNVNHMSMSISQSISRYSNISLCP